jgi:hypothetical protein
MKSKKGCGIPEVAGVVEREVERFNQEIKRGGGQDEVTCK